MMDSKKIRSSKMSSEGIEHLHCHVVTMFLYFTRRAHSVVLPKNKHIDTEVDVTEGNAMNVTAHRGEGRKSQEITAHTGGAEL